MPPSRSTKQQTSAVEFLVETYLATTDEIILGPRRAAVQHRHRPAREPRLVDHIPELVIMGGANATGT